MFRKLCFGVLAVALLVPAVWAQTVDEIIAKNVQARGGMDRLKAVQSIKARNQVQFGAPSTQASLKSAKQGADAIG